MTVSVGQVDKWLIQRTTFSTLFYNVLMHDAQTAGVLNHTDGHHDTKPAANGSRTTEIGNFTTVNCCQHSRVMSLHLLWTCPLCTINWAQSRLEMTFSSSQSPNDRPSLKPLANATQAWSGLYRWYQEHSLISASVSQSVKTKKRSFTRKHTRVKMYE